MGINVLDEKGNPDQGNAGETACATITIQLVQATVQLSLDLTSTKEALSTAEMALRAGIDWLEAGTPLILAAGGPTVTNSQAAVQWV